MFRKSYNGNKERYEYMLSKIWGTDKNGKKKPVPSLEDRKNQAYKLKNSYHNRLPILVCKDPRDTTDLQEITKHKFLVPCDLTVGQFLCIVRKYVKLTPEVAIFLYPNKEKLYGVSEMMQNIYEEDKSEDGFLYILYRGENTFG